MKGTIAALSSWSRRRHQIVNAFIAAGALVFAGLWLFESQTGLIIESDRWAYPAVIAFLVINLVVMRIAPRLQSSAELACFLGVAVYLLAQMVYFTFGPPAESIYNIAVALVWMPALYVAAFMFFEQRRAIVAAAIVFALSAVTLGMAIVIAARKGDVALPALFANGIASHLLVLLLLSLVMVLRSEFERVSDHARIMESAANTDPLTGIPNRRALEEWMEAWEKVPRRGTAALVLFDIDHFKAINDLHGHLVGDEILVSTAQLIRTQLRVTDFAGRWGGEEFLVILDDVAIENAMRFADRIRHLVAISPHPAAGPVTISAGVAICPPDASVDDAFRAADAALYAAKSGGRNRVSEGV